jgi:hypothetical protein
MYLEFRWNDKDGRAVILAICVFVSPIVVVFFFFFVGVKRQAGKWGSTAHAPPGVFCTFQKHRPVTEAVNAEALPTACE